MVQQMTPAFVLTKLYVYLVQTTIVEMIYFGHYIWQFANANCRRLTFDELT